MDTCDYLVDSYFPLHSERSKYEPAYAEETATWERVKCERFLDARHSSLLTRTLWMPGSRWQQLNSYGEFCVLRHKRNVEAKERKLALTH